MPLDYQDQFSLLKDILNNHQTDCCGSVAECEQVERLVKSLMINSNIEDGVKNVLQEIYSYSQTGAQTANLESHISDNQEHLSQWVSEIDQLT